MLLALYDLCLITNSYKVFFASAHSNLCASIAIFHIGRSSPSFDLYVQKYCSQEEGGMLLLSGMQRILREPLAKGRTR